MYLYVTLDHNIKFFFVHPQSPDFKLGWLYLGQILSYANKPYINIKLMYMYKSTF